MKKANTIAKIGIFAITALIVLMISFPYVVNASQESNNEDNATVSTDNKTSEERKGKKRKSEKKTKWENLSDEEKEAKKAERKAKYESMTDEEKQALKEKRKAKKSEKKENNNAENSQDA